LTTAPVPHLIDSNILLRLAKRDYPAYSLVRAAIKTLAARGMPLYFMHQNMAEFWNAATRPVEKNGFGIGIKEADLNAREFENAFTLLPDNDAVYRVWRHLVVFHEVKGVKVHDARLVAAMRVHGIAHLLTFNRPDFLRYTDIKVVDPAELSAVT
jgi:predicted nucleic acid-binding protein